MPPAHPERSPRAVLATPPGWPHAASTRPTQDTTAARRDDFYGDSASAPPSTPARRRFNLIACPRLDGR